MKKLFDDFDEKWYLIGTVVGIFAGIAIGHIVTILEII